jgi:ribose transport system permease protein
MTLTERYGRYGMLPVLLAILILARIENDKLFEWTTINTVLVQTSAIGIVAVGMTFVLIGGGIDISVGAIFAGGACVYARVAEHHPLGLAFVAAVGVGLAAGALNGLLVTRLRFNPFVVTLGTGSVYSGLVLLYTNGNAFYPTNPSFDTLGSGEIGGIAYLVIFLAGALLLGGFVLHRTSFGKSLFAVGGNLEASRLAGQRTDRIRLATYLLVGASAAIAGLLTASQTGSGSAELGGFTLVINVLLVVVLGGTALSGGEGAMWRTLVGILFLALLNNVFNVLAVTVPTQQLIQGAILVSALAFDAATRAHARGS